MSSNTQTTARQRDTRVTVLQQAQPSTDPLGDTAPDSAGAWTERQRVWGDVRYKSGIKTINADELQTSTRCSIRLAQNTCTLSITPGMRVSVRGQQFTVIEALPQGRESVDLVCEAV